MRISEQKGGSLFFAGVLVSYVQVKNTLDRNRTDLKFAHTSQHTRKKFIHLQNNRQAQGTDYDITCIVLGKGLNWSLDVIQKGKFLNPYDGERLPDA